MESGRTRTTAVVAAPVVAGPGAGIADPADRLGSFRPVRIRKAADVVVDILVDAIRNGLYGPGEKLPRERDLAAQLEVSRTTIREATSILQRAGVLSVRRGNGGGAVVLSPAIPPTLLSSIHHLDRADEMRSLLEVRRPLELLASVLAVRRGTEAAFADIRDLVVQLETLMRAPVDDFMYYDLQIHTRIVQASQNRSLVRHLDEIYKQQATLRAEYPVKSFDPEYAVELHWAAVDALFARDEVRMVEIVDDHLGSVEKHIFGERLELNPGFAFVAAKPQRRSVRRVDVRRQR